MVIIFRNINHWQINFENQSANVSFSPFSIVLKWKVKAKIITEDASEYNELSTKPIDYNRTWEHLRNKSLKIDSSQPSS